MCSFLFSTKIKYNDIDNLNFYLKFRGPDYTYQNTFNNHLFIHNLLSLTGKFTKQPFIKDDIVLLYNGEIYNYNEFGDYGSDGECLIPLYEKYGDEFIKKLDGEFAICLIDYKNNKIIISSDIFKTKPLFFAISKSDIGVCTYKTPLEKLGFKPISAEPNTTYIICLKTKKIINKKNIYDFDLTQHKNSYDDWIISFENSIKKRISNTNKKLFIGLSSGYDSGLIYNELLKNKINFHAFSLIGTENEKIIDDRLLIKTDDCISHKIIKNNGDYTFSHMLIRKNTESFKYTIKDSTNDDILLINDNGSNNFATVCRKAKQNECKICLSGCGADEIISDYGFNGKKFYPHSNFGGLFPENLNDIFPWNSFYKSTMESYIAKEEYVGGSFGMEVRYPFLDKKVVQEFLWLSQKLKNKEYKAPIDFYFNKNNFPYEKLIKRGF